MEADRTLPSLCERILSMRQILTLDDKSSLVLSGVFHCIQCLFSDAIQIYISPVLQHLKGDVCTVDHRSRGLQDQT